jgi:type I restriction enzyme S subunit
MRSAELRKAILQAAVQGKLAFQDPNDEPAAELLKRIRQEKARLAKEGKIRKEKPLPPITKDEIPYDLPDGWVWCRLGDIILKNIGGGTPSKQNPEYWDGSIPWVSVKDLNCDILTSTTHKSKEQKDSICIRQSKHLPILKCFWKA